jgi:DNA-binding beta-propeller fold protein YncE
MSRINKTAAILFCTLTCIVMLILEQISSAVSQPNEIQSLPDAVESANVTGSTASNQFVVAQANTPSTAQRNRTAPLNFQGRMLVTISDADMVASAYVDRQLGAREGQDALSIIPLGGDYRQMRGIELAGVTNSVAGPPSAVTVSPDGRWAFVVESFKPATEAMTLFTDLELGNRLTAIDLSNPRQPRIHRQIDVGTRPETVEISPKGDMLLVTLHPVDGRQLVFVPWNNGEFGTPTYTTFINVAADVRVSHAVWHPSGNYIAGGLVDQGQVVFARVIRSGNTVTLESWGTPVLVGKYPFKIMFMRNGQYLITTNLQWGSDVRDFWVEAPRGSIGVVRFSTETQQEGQPQHFLVSVAETGVSPEGIAISPDGTMVVTTNLERSYLPYDDPRITWFSSLTLMQFDQKTGHLQKLGDFLYDGILPESLVFDRSGQYLAVANYDHFDDDRQGGSVDFWRVVTNDLTHPTPRLVQTNHSVPVTRGVHSMVLVP